MLTLTPDNTRMTPLLLWAFMVIAAADPRCDPHTQYVKDGQCCKMCGPGTRLASGSCQEPICLACGENEYQDKYTSEKLCQRQPFCNKLKNFQEPVHNPKVKTTCLCKLGFHCSSVECITCVPHLRCQPGHGVKQQGNQTHDTVCEKCPEGKFSNESSWSDACTDWTKCENGFQIKQLGSDTTDSICEKSSRTHIIILAVLLTLILFLAIAVLVYWKRNASKGQLKDCVECLREKREPLRENNVLVTTPTEPTDEDEVSPLADLSSQEEGCERRPEENEDEQRMTSGVFTENGNFVTQENGKSEILSRQESQTQAFTD